MVPHQAFIASGVAISGAGFGGMAYSLAVAAMIDSLGQAYAFRILGIFAVLDTICSNQDP